MVFDTTSDDDVLWGYGMGCPGVVEVLVERFDPCGDLKEISRCLDERRPLQIATSLQEGSLGVRTWRCDHESQGASSLLDVDGDSIFFEDVPPGPRLVIVGAGNDALPLEAVAREVGWITCVADYRAEFAVKHRFPWADQLLTASLEELTDLLAIDSMTFVVVMTHGYLADRTLLPGLLDSASPYVGLVSSRRRSDRLLSDLGRSRVSKFHAPVGLDLGAEGPEEIALAIIAEMQGVLAACAVSV